MLWHGFGRAFAPVQNRADCSCHFRQARGGLAVRHDGMCEQENVRSVEAEAGGNADYLFTVQYSDC